MIDDSISNALKELQDSNGYESSSDIAKKFMDLEIISMKRFSYMVKHKIYVPIEKRGEFFKDKKL